MIRERTGLQIRRVGPEAHGPADRIDTKQVAQLVNHGIRRVRIEFGTVGGFHATNVERVFDDGALHPEADAEVRNLLFPRILDRANHSGNPAFAEASGNENAIELTELRRLLSVFEALGLDPVNPGSQIVNQPAMDESLAEALVCIF